MKPQSRTAKPSGMQESHGFSRAEYVNGNLIDVRCASFDKRLASVKFAEERRVCKRKGIATMRDFSIMVEEDERLNAEVFEILFDIRATAGGNLQGRALEPFEFFFGRRILFRRIGPEEHTVELCMLVDIIKIDCCNSFLLHLLTSYVEDFGT